jgi:hypothetical protein
MPYQICRNKDKERGEWREQVGPESAEIAARVLRRVEWLGYYPSGNVLSINQSTKVNSRFRGREPRIRAPVYQRQKSSRTAATRYDWTFWTLTRRGARN